MGEKPGGKGESFIKNDNLAFKPEDIEGKRVLDLKLVERKTV